MFRIEESNSAIALALVKRICKFIVSASGDHSNERSLGNTVVAKFANDTKTLEVSYLASARICLESDEIKRVEIGSRHLFRIACLSDGRITRYVRVRVIWPRPTIFTDQSVTRKIIMCLLV